MYGSQNFISYASLWLIGDKLSPCKWKVSAEEVSLNFSFLSILFLVFLLKIYWKTFLSDHDKKSFWIVSRACIGWFSPGDTKLKYFSWRVLERAQLIYLKVSKLIYSDGYKFSIRVFCNFWQFWHFWKFQEDKSFKAVQQSHKFSFLVIYLRGPVRLFCRIC